MLFRNYRNCSWNCSCWCFGWSSREKAFIKAIKKIGGRVAGGIGLVVIAIDFAICMSADSQGAISSPNTCDDLLVAKSLKTGETIYISKNDINLIVNNNFAQNIEQTKQYKLYSVSYGYTSIAIQDVTENTPCIVKESKGLNSFIFGKRY